MEHEHRNRASGWKHAKLSGHANEASVNKLLNEDIEYQQDFLIRTGYQNEKIVRSTIGGLHETNVIGVLGKKTKSKTDLKVYCESGKQINVSIKKSLGGQVYFVRAGLFFDVFEKQFNKSIPQNVKRAIELFWASSIDAVQIIEQFGDKSKSKDYDMQIRHHSLNAATLKSYNATLYNDMLLWFENNAFELTQLAFSMGAAKESSEWSEFVWYINTLGENEIDEIFCINDICSAAIKVSKEETYYGASNGGTTIQLPFGFVQWHQGQMQFHHNYEKVKRLARGR